MCGLDNARYAAGEGYFNWEYNNIYDLWSSGSQYLSTTFNTPNNLLWRQNRLVAMCDGWYKISLDLTYAIDQDIRFKRGYIVDGKEKTVGTGGTWTFSEFPTEFQLVKNSSDGLDVKPIHPDAITSVTFIDYGEDSLTITDEPTIGTIGQYKTEQIAAYPHEGTWIDLLDNFDINNIYLGGYCPRDNNTLNYDPSVNPNFVLGCTSSGAYNYTSVIKNGKSWRKDCSDVAQARYISATYNGMKLTTGAPIYEVATNDYGKNTLPNSTMSITRNGGTSVTAHIDAIVFLNKNDYLQLKMLERQWTNKDDVADWNYGATSQTDAIINVSGNIKFEMFAPSDKLTVDSDYMDWDNDTLFPKMLNLSEFLNNEEKMSDFINNFIKEFNLSYSQNGKVISLNKQHIDFNTKNAVDLTDRVSDGEMEFEAIDFPSQISVEYTINEDERGFYISAERNATDEQIQRK